MLHRFKKDEGGFTLIELLVVILIIGILAAIALPTFLGQQNKGKDASAKSDARNTVTKVESCYTDEQNYSNCEEGDTAMAQEALPSSVDIQIPTSGTNLYSVVATSETGTTFTITKLANGSYTRTCSAPGEGGCSSGSGW